MLYTCPSALVLQSESVELRVKYVESICSASCVSSVKFLVGLGPQNIPGSREDA